MAKRIKRFIELFRFCVVGCLNTGIDFAVFAALFAWGMPLFPAHVLSYSCGIVNSFILNQKWTFKKGIDQPGAFHSTEPVHYAISPFVRFIVLNLFSMAITYCLLVWIHDTWGWSMFVSRLFAVIISLAINFIGSSLWVFRQGRLSSNII